MNCAVSTMRRGSGYQRLKSSPHSENTLVGTLSVMRLRLYWASVKSVIRECRIRFLPQSYRVEFIQRDVPDLAQEQQVRQEVAHERRQMQCGRTRLNREHRLRCWKRRARRAVVRACSVYPVQFTIQLPGWIDLGGPATEHQLGRAVAVDGIHEVVHDHVVEAGGDRRCSPIRTGRPAGSCRSPGLTRCRMYRGTSSRHPPRWSRRNDESLPCARLLTVLPPHHRRAPVGK